MNRQHINSKQGGQVVLITLLVLTVAITLVLAFIGRTTSDSALTSQSEDSARAFNAAEAGIESALKSGTNAAEILVSGEKYDVTVQNLGGAAGVYEFPRKSLGGLTETIWMTEHAADGSLDESTAINFASPAKLFDLCWTKETVTPALIVNAVYKRAGEYYVARRGYDPDAARRTSNKFVAPTSTSGTACGKTDVYKVRLDLLNVATFGLKSTDTLIMLRVRPLYSATSILFDPAGAVLPLQAKRLESTGSVVSGATRKIVVYQQYRLASSMFDAVLYSQSSLVN